MNFIKQEYKKLAETVYTAVHESGLRIVLIKKEGFKKKYATFSTKYGSVNTEFVVPGETQTTKVIDGIAHFLEHKVFEQPDGTNAFNEFSKYGASANAFTSFGVTNYLFSCTEHFKENLEILLDFVQKPYFTEENVEKEKGIIAQEIRMYADDADQTCFYNCLRGMYVNHPIKTEIAGSVEEIMKTTPELLYKCYNTFYHPSNMALICVGDIEVEEIAEAVEKYISKEPAAGKIKQVFPKEPDYVCEKYIEAKFDVPKAMFMLGFKDSHTGGSGSEMLARDILTNCVMRVMFGKSSAFRKRMYESGKINKTFSCSYEYEDSCAFAAFSGEADNPDEIKNEIYAEIEKFVKEGIDEEAFERAKKVVIGCTLSMHDSVEELGNEYMFAFHRGIDLYEYIKICESLTATDANRRVKQLFDKEMSSLSVVFPKKTEG